MDALRRWTDKSLALAIPPAILAAAPASPYGFPVGMFQRRAEEALGSDTPSQRRAREALPDGGCILDVGCGGGAASLPLAASLGRAVGVDESQAMLDAFAARAEQLGVAHTEIRGCWPDVAAAAPVADVVACHHVLYNAPHLGPFAEALTARAGRRVVVELTAEHPLAWLVPLWRRLHGLARAPGPTAEDAVAALTQLGIRAEQERFDAPSPWTEIDDDVVAFVRQRLCVAPERDPEVRDALEATGVPRSRTLVTLWWQP